MLRAGGEVSGVADCAFVTVDGSEMQDNFRPLFGQEDGIFGEWLASTADDNGS